jgi:uncharacterized protein YbaR (Trm112 family)
MNKKLMNILVCPVCKGKLRDSSVIFGSTMLGSVLGKRGNELVCEYDGLVFPVDDGVPMLNMHDARKLDTVK